MKNASQPRSKKTADIVRDWIGYFMLLKKFIAAFGTVAGANAHRVSRLRSYVHFRLLMPSICPPPNIIWEPHRRMWVTCGQERYWPPYLTIP